MPSILIPTALVALADVKAELPALGADTSQDAYLEGLINSYTLAFESYTRRKLKSRKYMPTGANLALAEENLTLNGDDRVSPTEFWLPQWPVTLLSAVTIKDSQLVTVKTLTLASDVVLDGETGQMRLIDGDTWERGIQNILASFTGGYTTVPQDLVRAFVIQVAWGFYQKDRSRQGMESISSGSETVTYFTGAILPEVKMILNKYQRVLVGRS